MSLATGPADFAEMLEVSTGASSVEAGDLIVLDPAHPRSVRRSRSARSTLVVGIVSTQPGFVGSSREGDREIAGDVSRRELLDRDNMASLYDEVPVAVIGIVPAKACAEDGAIAIGDFLV